MRVKVEINDGQLSVQLIPADEWEQLLIGALAKGGQHLEATVSMEWEGHYSYRKTKVAQVTLRAPASEA